MTSLVCLCLVFTFDVGLVCLCLVFTFDVGLVCLCLVFTFDVGLVCLCLVFTFDVGLVCLCLVFTFDVGLVCLCLVSFQIHSSFTSHDCSPRQNGVRNRVSIRSIPITIYFISSSNDWMLI